MKCSACLPSNHMAHGRSWGNCCLAFLMLTLHWKETFPFLHVHLTEGNGNRFPSPLFTLSKIFE